MLLLGFMQSDGVIAVVSKLISPLKEPRCYFFPNDISLSHGGRDWGTSSGWWGSDWGWGSKDLAFLVSLSVSPPHLLVLHLRCRARYLSGFLWGEACSFQLHLSQ